MIVDTMTLQEVGEYILKASQKSIGRIEKMIEDKEKDYKKIILKRQKERYDFQPFSFTVDGIEFHICPYSKSKKVYKKYGILLCVFAHLFYHGTNWYCLITNNYQHVSMFCNHFFIRYIERHLKDDTIVCVDIVRKYFKETRYYCYGNVNHPKYKNCLYSSTNIGICCGEIVSNHVLVYKTYIDLETITIGEKKNAFDDGQNAVGFAIRYDYRIKDLVDVA